MPKCKQHYLRTFWPSWPTRRDLARPSVCSPSPHEVPRRRAATATVGHRPWERGHDAVHTLDLQQANRTPDAIINQVSVAEERLVITKDSDFVDSLIVQGVPHKLGHLHRHPGDNRDAVFAEADMLFPVSAIVLTVQYMLLPRPRSQFPPLSSTCFPPSLGQTRSSSAAWPRP